MLPWPDCGKEFETYFDTKYANLDEVITIKSGKEFKQHIEEAWNGALLSKLKPNKNAVIVQLTNEGIIFSVEYKDAKELNKLQYLAHKLMDCLTNN